MKEKHLELWRTLEIVFLMEQGLPTSIVSSRVFDLKSSLAYFLLCYPLFFYFFSLSFSSPSYLLETWVIPKGIVLYRFYGWFIVTDRKRLFFLPSSICPKNECKLSWTSLKMWTILIPFHFSEFSIVILWQQWKIHIFLNCQH